MKIANFIISLVCGVSLLFISCEQEDKPVFLPPKTGSAISSVSMGETYNKQVWFNLETGKWKDAIQEEWDLGFECSSKGFHVVLNGGKFVLAKSFNDTFLLNPTIKVPASMNWDTPNGHNDSTAFGLWLDTVSGNSHKQVYVVDKGELFHTAADRYWKIQLLEVTANHYSMRYCRLNNADQHCIELPKNTTKNFVYFSFEQGQLEIEPAADDWHLLFTRYRHLYYEMSPIFPYLVNGILLNPNQVSCFKDSLIGFDKMDLATAKKLPFQTEQNYIGFEWKDFDRSTNKYTVRRYYCYVLRDYKGQYFKFRFLDFYDSQGKKGYPKFEYKSL
ncbi:MAG: hypothetical protein EXR21_01575 [Flavobacteriaceae bacterium]|nr:hypothetical protein [Flavobacteriaceae bacterium]